MNTSSATPQELIMRVLASVLRIAVRIAVRARVPTKKLTKLLQVTYYQELRKNPEHSVKDIANLLGVSPSTVDGLSARSRSNFYAPETEIEPQRRLILALRRKPLTMSDLKAALPKVKAADLKRHVQSLIDVGWAVACTDNTIALTDKMPSMAHADLIRRFDGLNHQMDITADAIWTGFVGQSSEALARSWTVLTTSQEFEALQTSAIQTLRYAAVDAEERALAEHPGNVKHYSMTLTMAPSLEDSDEESSS